MKKVIKGLITLVVAIGMLIPSVVAADCPDEWGNCCEYEGCCRALCCANQTFDYKIRYFEKVEVGMFQGKPCYAGVWTTVIVEDAHNRDGAAESLGLRAGYSCWVTRVF